MFKILIRPRWTIRRTDGTELPQRLIELLGAVHERGSLLAGCEAIGLSYRHAWGLLREAEAGLGAPLVLMERGKGSTLTALGERLVWADRRIDARLSPALDMLGSEIEVELRRTLSAQPSGLRIHASHGFAMEVLHAQATAADIAVELKYCSAEEALGALRNGHCELAGMHLPIGEQEAAARRHYGSALGGERQRLVHVATRRQGLMVAPGNPRKIYELADLARNGVRFVNRQPGSGTRLLLDLLLKQAKVQARRIDGYQQSEFTHAAVAAYVASGMADAAFGVETPARRFGLDFIPLHNERYFLLCDAATLESPAVVRVLDVLRSPAFRVATDALAGYDAEGAGEVSAAAEAWLAPAMRRGKAG
ncbi:substrate-binding domain-containing protein [Derxia gummosa]|uniref:Substrate-binding domain-containing protein n=1 Tax=Derxia gummosa DSM 723 TaxID=1121388 RepID=A0A8B6X6L2_9BURK|nr:substrate-binding domain-containing protein [Derxia gummosa]